MFKKVLIANRGEIAVRIIRCLREMNIETVAVYSKADEDALHTQLASQSVCIGDCKAADSYLNMERIISVAISTKCEAIHPGFGFLSENSEFARKCREFGIIFIGPSPEVIDKMGNKAAARELMIKSGVPVVPGSAGTILDSFEAKTIADKMGYPVLIKASAGGGGRGMRRAYSTEEVEKAFDDARQEAIACFGNGDMYMEKLIINPRHIEFQILADKFGNTVHLGERDCSIQRKNQKMLEESPSMALSEESRKNMGATAVLAAKAADYENAGTIEFVVDSEGNYFFIEMNTRIQVEHPVTEMVTGIDLIKEQIRIACGMKLSFNQEDIKISGHAIECRINAEIPAEGFRGNVGKISLLHLPGGYGVRIDTMLFHGYEISPYYDSMIAKVIVHGNTRTEAIKRMRRVLEELVIDGVKTTADFEYLLLYHPDFLRGRYDTGFIEANLDEILGWDSFDEDEE